MIQGRRRVWSLLRFFIRVGSRAKQVDLTLPTAVAGPVTNPGIIVETGVYLGIQARLLQECRSCGVTLSPFFMRVTSLLFCFVFLCLSLQAAVVRADDSSPAIVSLAAKLDELYRSFDTLYLNGKLGEATEVIERLHLEALNNGYRNLPEYSNRILTLSREKEVPFPAVDPSNVRGYLIRHAIALSPTDSFVLLHVVGLPGMPVLHRLSFFGSALKSLSHYPSLVLSAFHEMGLTFLTAMTIALLLVIALGVFINSADILEGVSLWLPYRLRGVFAPLTLAVLLIFPLFLGIVPWLIVGGSLLAAYGRGFRSISLAISALIILWIVGIHFSSQLFSQVGATSSAIEEVNNGSFLSRAEEIVKIDKTSSDLILTYARAILGARNGEWEVSDKLLRTLFVGPLHDWAVISYAYVAAKTGKPQEGKTLLESEEIPAFEYYYNLSSLNMQVTDVDGYTRSADKANALDKRRFDELKQLNAPVLVSLPISLLIERLYHTTADVAKNSSIETLRISGALKWPGIPWSACLIASLLLSAFTLISRAHGNGEAVKERWTLLIPGSLSFLQGAPVTGLLFLSVDLWLLMLFLTIPFEGGVLVQLFSVIELPCLGLAGILFLVHVLRFLFIRGVAR